MFQVGGYEPATVTDFEIPKKYGLRQTIADTLGIGGIMRALRSIPVLNGIAEEMERSCPNALLMNYVNPMAPLVWGVSQATSIKTVGLCHSVQGTAAELASFLDIPADEIDYDCAGINHMAFYTRFERNGEDLYPALRALEASKTYPAWETPRFTLMRDFGYFVTESSEHLSEYVPWLIKDDRDDLIDRYSIPLDEYPARCVDQIADWSSMRAALLSDDPEAIATYQTAKGETLSGNWERKLARERLRDPESEARLRARLLEERHAHQTGHSGEYGTLIIHAMTTGAAVDHLGQCPERRTDRQSAGRLRGRSRLQGRPDRPQSTAVRRAATTARVADDDQYQSAADDGRCRAQSIRAHRSTRRPCSIRIPPPSSIPSRSAPWSTS